MLKKAILISILMFSSFVVPAQKSIKGTYSSKPGLGVESFKFDKNFHYEYTSSSCVSTETDHGIYHLNGDTIIFQSLLKPEETEQKIQIIADNGKIEPGVLIDSLEIDIHNPFIKEPLSIDLFLNNQVILHLDSFKENEWKYFKFFVNIPSDSIQLLLVVNNVKSFIYKNNNVSFTIQEETWQRKRPFKYKMIYEGNKIYPVWAYNYFHKKFYIYKEK
ncbi:MAG: hypothetical protein ACOYMA_08095 [Bacteroidia bacterium]